MAQKKEERDGGGVEVDVLLNGEKNNMSILGSTSEVEKGDHDIQKFLGYGIS